MELKKQLIEEYNIRLDFTELVYKKNGRIKRVAITVDCQDGFSGSASYSKGIGRSAKVYFYRDYKRGANDVFGVSAGK